MMNSDASKMSSVKQSVITALMIALSAVLPMAFHSIPQAGAIFCPMHIPVIICGLVCSWQFGLICGIVAPVLSSIAMGMPSAADLPSMILELISYAVISSLLMKFVKTKRTYADLYLSLVPAMLFGRVVAGVSKAFIFARGSMTISTWAVSYFVTSLPSILIQLIFIPAVYVGLQKAGLIPARYVFSDDGDEE